jgi:hypothetical protein
MATDKDGKTRRSILIEVAGGAAAMAGGAAGAQAQSAPGDRGRIKEVDDQVRKILAVAVGRKGHEKSFTIDKNTSTAELETVRPYIRGAIDWLKNYNLNADLDPFPKTFELGDGTGSGYTINYREVAFEALDKDNPVVFSNLTGIDCIVCMSTFVGEKAAASTTNTPIVVITSDPSNDKFGANVCGVCALRPQLTGLGLRNFKKKFGLTKVYGLNRDKYKPSAHAKKEIGKGIPANRWVDVKDNENDDAVLDKIRAIPDKNNAGLLIMPADRFFGIGDAIVTEAAPMKTYWPTTDWPKRLDGGYGYPQYICGQYMGQRIASIWSTGSLPDELYLTVDPKEIKSYP